MCLAVDCISRQEVAFPPETRGTLDQLHIPE